MKNINILDCTLRDGGYYNNWDFSTNLINDYLRSMPLAGVDYVELGFRSLYKSTFKGACAYTKDEFLDTLKIPKKLKVAVMVNASDLLNFGTKDPIKNTRLLFSHKRNSKVTLVRIAAHHYEIKKILPGNKLILNTTIKNYKRGIANVEGRAFVDETLVCSADFKIIMPDELKKYKIK